MKLIDKNGDVIYDGDIETTENILRMSSEFSGSTDPDDYQTIFSDDEKKQLIRNKITEKVGDQASILGTTADASQLSLYANAVLIQAISDYGADKLKASVSSLLPFATQFLSGIDSGEIKTTFAVKGVENVVEDVSERMTKVSGILEQSQS